MCHTKKAFPSSLSTSLALPFHWLVQASLPPSFSADASQGSGHGLFLLESLNSLSLCDLIYCHSFDHYLLTTPRLVTANLISSLSFSLVDISVCMYQPPRTQQK